jgi:hypothetical protein
MLTTATVELLSQLGATLEWENTGSVGSIYVGEVSNLYVKANLSTSSFSLKYQLTGPVQLPAGLTLEKDGTIQGIPTQWPIDNSINTYTFSVSVSDSTGYNLISNDTFKIETKNTSPNYTNVYFKSHLELEKRKEYSDFTLNRNIFIPELIYRPLDLNFGIQRNLIMCLHFGVEIDVLDSYISDLANNFSRRKVRLGGIKTAIAKENNKEIYELIYADVIDDYNLPNTKNTSTSFVFNGNTCYPPSINNMRNSFKYSTSIETTENLNPKFTKTIQSGKTTALGYIPFVPICYCIPGKSSLILKKIQDSKFKFNKINFEIDRLYFKRTNTPLLSQQTPDISRYLLFNKRN